MDLGAGRRDPFDPLRERAPLGYNAEAEANWGGDIPTHIPTDGYYKFATNPTQKKTKKGNTTNDATKADWFVAGAFKVNRILSDVEADSVVNEYNRKTGRNVPLDYRRNGGRVFNAETMQVEDGVQYSLSPQQEEFFKDSVVRDENGNLKVMYHGTSSGGHTMFDPYGKARYGLFGAGSYFTDSKEVAESYTRKGKGQRPQVYETYLNIKNPMDMDAQADPAQWKKAFPEATFPDSGTNEQFYRAMEEYFEDEQYPRWEAAEEAMMAIEDMGYDGITHIGGGRLNKADDTRHRVYIAFQPEQIKDIGNASPTSNPDIRYSLSEQETNKKLNTVGLQYDSKSGTISYSMTSLEEAFDYNKSEADYLAARLEYEVALAKSIAVDKNNVTKEEQEKAKRYLDSLFLIHDMIAMDRDRLDYESAVGRSAWVSNTVAPWTSPRCVPREGSSPEPLMPSRTNCRTRY